MDVIIMKYNKILELLEKQIMRDLLWTGVTFGLIYFILILISNL